MSFLRRGTLGLALAALTATVLAPTAHADNLESDTLVSGTAALGNVCRGATATGSVGFVLKRVGGTNGQVWANSASVTITPGSQPAGFTLGGTSVTTPSTWAAFSNNTLLDAGDAAVSLAVPANATTGARTASVTYSASGAESGGGTVTRTTPVTFTWNVVDCAPADTSAPVISKVLTPATPDGANGWYRSNVAVDWTVTEPESAATLQGCVDAALTTDGSLTTSCSATSSGGSAGPVSVTVKRDATPPTLEPVVSGELGANGWYVGDVAVSWKATDATSGIDLATACAAATLSDDTSARTFSCTVRDLAGNAASASVTVKRDSTAPVIVSHVSGTLGKQGWYVSDIDISFDVSDATSSVSSSGCDAVKLDEDTAGETYTCTATDGAGHSASATVGVKRDATAPDVTFTRNGLEGDNNWYRGPVTLDWTVSDNLSGLAGVQGCTDRSVTADGRHSFGCSVTDAAGNPTDATALVDIDATAPVITPDVSGPTKGTAWYTGDVSVKWDVDDPTSGIAEGPACDEVTLTEDTDGTTYTCSATDVAGNSDSKSVTVKRDATAPVVTPLVSGTHNGDWYTGDVSVTWAITEATSGVGSTSGCGPVTVDTDTRGETYTCSVTDRAGNPASGSVTVKRDATAPVITPVVTGPQKGTEWYTGDVSVKWDVSDPTSGIADSQGCDVATLTEDTTGTTYTCSATDVAGNSDMQSVTVKRDATAPVLTLTGGPTNGATYYFGDVPAPSTCTATDVTSQLAGPCTVTAGGTTVGAKTQVATATDQAGNVTTEERKYTVAAWRLDGFYKPVTMGTSVVNTVKAGSTVPLKFNVYKGAVPMTAGIGATFSATKVSCDGSDVQDPVDFVTTGATSLRYDAAGGQWIQNWATPSGGKGSCYRVTMTTDDGSKISADFALK